MTIGEERIRVSFNPSEDELVAKIKGDSAALVDVLEQMKTSRTDEPGVLRLIALAQTAYEEAAMWAVKAATA